MIIAEQKPFQEILGYLEPFQRVLIAGCKGCVTVCNAGGENEVAIISEAIQLARRSAGRPIQIQLATVERQCDREFLALIKPQVEQCQAVLSLACGAGVQFLAECYPKANVFPGVNTTFIGVNEAAGTYGERCQACGNCKLALTGGVCPIARCSKSLLNGPCGGSQDGHCEINPEVPCGWQLIIDRLQAIGRLDDYLKIIEANDWDTSRDGGPRRIVREDLK